MRYITGRYPIMRSGFDLAAPDRGSISPVANQTALVGAMTLEDHAAWIVKNENGGTATGKTVSGGTATGVSYDSVSGRISPDANGGFAGQDGSTIIFDDGGVVTLSVASDVYSVGSVTEAAAAFTAIGTAGGKTVRFLNGTCTGGYTPRLAQNIAFSSRVTLTGVSGALVLGGMQFQNTQKVTVSGLDIYLPGVSSASVVNFLGTCTEMIVEDNTIRGTYYDPLSDLSGAGAYGNCYGIANSSDGSNHNFSGIIRRNLIRDVHRGVVLTCDSAGGFDVIDNEICYIYEDGMTLSVTSDGLTATKTTSRNVFHHIMSRGGDAAAPHTDLIQWLSNFANHGLDLTNWVCEQNIGWEDETEARGNGVQGIGAFTDGGYNVIIKDAVIRDNSFHVSGNHPISIYAIDGGTIENNTCTNPAPDSEATGDVTMRLGYISSAGTITVRDNVCDGFSLAGAATYSQSGNVTLGSKGATIAYTTQFTGPDFPVSTFAEVKTAWAVQSGSAGALGSGHSVYGDVRDESGWSYPSSDYDNYLILNESGTSTIVAVDELMVQIDGGSWQTVAAAGLTVSQSPTGDIAVSGFTGSEASVKFHYEKQDTEPYAAASSIDALYVEDATSGVSPAVTGLPGIPLSPTKLDTPVEATA